MRYDLGGLGPDQFEHLSQALAVAILGPHVRVFGAGPDGGREAAFDGPTWYPHPDAEHAWNGYGVVQAKYKATLSSGKPDLAWLGRELKKELEGWVRPTGARRRHGRLPQYFVLTTNVSLSAVAGSGGKDRIDADMAQYAERMGLKDWAVWDAVQITAYLDAYPQVAQSFAALITPSAVLATLLKRIHLQDRTPDVCNLPPRNPHFVGRRDLIEQIERKWASNSTAVVVLHGMGGIGKSQLALELAHGRRRRDQAGLAWWIRGEDPAILVGDLAALGPELGLTESSDLQLQARQVIGLLSHRKNWLLVFDNVINADMVHAWIPSGNGSVLITSRNKDWGGLAHAYAVSEFAEHESQLYLQRREIETGELADELAALVGNLPLALAQAASYMDRSGLSLSGYLKLYRNHEGAGKLLASGLAGYPNSVATTWLSHFGWLQQNAPASLELLRLCAFLHPDEIDLPLLLSEPQHLAQQSTRRLADALTQAANREEAIAALIASGLATRLTDDRIRLHRLVSQVTRQQLRGAEGDDVAQEWATSALNLLVALIPEDPTDPQNWRLMALLAPHLETAAGHAPSTLLAAIGLTETGQYMETRAQYRKAEALLRTALDINEHADTVDLDECARTISSLGIVQLELGTLEQARASQVRALAMYEELYGPRGLDVARVCSNLGIILRQLGDFCSSEDTLLKAVAIYESHNGPHDITVARTLNNLGSTLHQLGKLDDARATLERALTIKETLYGPDHVEMAPTLSNLANIEQEIGQLDLALRHHLRALAIFETVYGPEHPEVAVELGNLGIVDDLRGELHSALAYHVRSLDILESVYGPDHHEVGRTLTNICKVEVKLGDITDARQNAERAAVILSHQLGSTHRYTKTAMELLDSTQKT